MGEFMTHKPIRILNLIDDCPCPEVFEPLKRLGEVVDVPPDHETYLCAVEDADGVLTSLKVRTDREILESANRLRAVATPSTGTDHIDVETAREKGIAVLSLKGDLEFLSQITATAELAWGLLLSTVRKIPWAFEAARRGDWARDRFRGNQLSGKTLGIVGLGRLGSIVAEYGRAFRMKVLAADPNLVDPPDGIELLPFHELLERSDVVSIHIHLTEETRGIFDRVAFQSMKPGSILVNTSRGAVLDEAAFLEVLQSGPLAGAGIDVIDGEWRSDLEVHPLIVHSRLHANLVITPHIGGVTLESQRMAYERITAKLIDRLTQPVSAQGEF